ncbi:MAG: DUF2807 domain-containing protein [Spirochaetales bacterium]|nr:DUF2807 domain-containing protein [Spirochaetales bacterium]
MLKRVYLLFFCLLFASCFVHRVEGSGKIETREFDFSNFTELKVGHSFFLEILEGDEFFISMDLDDNLYKYLSVSQFGDELRFKLDSKYQYRHTAARIKIIMPNISALTLSGATNTTLNFLEIDQLDIKISGASRLDASLSQVDCLSIKASGASKITLQGSSKCFDVKISGASKLDSKYFFVDNLESVDLSGASSMSISARHIQTVNLSGASSFKYHGKSLKNSFKYLKSTGASRIESF